MKFYDLYKANKVSLGEIDDYIDEWCNGDSDELLSEYLGLTERQYRKWVMTDELDK